MKMLFNHGWHSILISLFGMLALSACVNEDYDFTKEIDTDMTILENVSMPVGSIEAISISDILTLEDGSDSIIGKDENGDFVFTFTGSGISAEIDVPSLSIAPADGIHTEPMEVHFSTGPAAGLDPSMITGSISYSEVTGGILDAPMHIEIDSELPEQIADVKSVDIAASIYLNFTVNTGAVHLAEGFVIEFPDFMNVTKSGYTDERFELVDNQKLVAKENILVSSSSPLAFALMTDKINVPSGVISGGRLVLEDEVHLRGDFYLSPSDFSVIPDKVIVNIKADIIHLDVVSAQVKLNIDEEIAGSMFALKDLPDFLSGGNICLDIYNPILKMGVSNDTPFAYDVKAEIVAVKGSETVSLKLGESPAISIPANSSVNYHVSRREIPVTEGVTNIVSPKIGDMISMLPETISFKDIRLTSSGSDFVTITPGEKYQAAVSYEVYAPLAFDKDLKIEYTQDVNNLNLRIEDVLVESIDLALTLENTVPVGFAFNDVKAIDSEGNVIEGVTITVDKEIQAGNLASPSITQAKLSLRSQSGSVEFDGLRLGIKAVAPASDLYGVALNEKQGLKISDIVLTVPEGITYINSEK